YQLPAALADVRVPGMILQPLVENSVKHAVAPTGERVTITLAARTEHGQLVLTVSDDGRGQAMEAMEATRPGFGIGLANVRDRLATRFGGEASVVSGAGPGGYATVLRLPILTLAECRP
ncbi:MAG: ATP-binding protein, partial [Croceibacterium sp.]